MPLLSSPIDGSPMKEIERYGIKLDLCPTSGGIWFDKGEVEKLIYFIREETIKEQNNNYAESDGSDDQSGYFSSKNRKGQPQKRKRENPLAELFDMFEF